MGARRQSCSTIDRSTEVVTVADGRDPGVHSDTHFEGELTDGFEERELHVEGRLDRLGRRLERHREAVAGRGEDIAVVTLDDRADPPVVFGERLRHRVRGSIPERGRPLDVREQERDIAGGQDRW